MVKLSPKMWYLLKYGFLALIMTGIMVTVLPMPRPGDGPDLIDRLGENFSDPYVPPSVESYRTLRPDVKTCFTNVSGDLWDGSPAGSENNESDSEAFQTKQATSMFGFLSEFNAVLSAVGVEGAIVEPSLLHCMIHPHYRGLLSQRHFDVTRAPLAKNVVTYAVTGRDAAVLQQEDVLANFSEAGFVAHVVTSPRPDWMKTNSTTLVSHILYRRERHAVHVVVFYERGAYFWHDALHPADQHQVLPGLHFAQHSGAYEKFTFFPLINNGSPLPSFFIPSSSHYFLLETLSSRFLECNATRPQNYSRHPRSHPGGMSGERFNRRALTSTRQLKSIFHPLLMNFWMWSGTMLGWYRDCDVIPYTSDVDFGAWASEVEDLSWIVRQLINSKHVRIRELMGRQEEALEFNINCYGLRTDVFFLYEIKNGSWCSGHSPKQGYYFRYYYPPFTLCSAELLGEKVQVPCEAERLIETEYGAKWREPASSWHYETSIKNRGPNIYWKRDPLKKTYVRY